MLGRKREIKDEAASLLRKGRYAKALELFQEVVAKDPTDHSSRRNVGYILRKLGRIEEAVQVFVDLANEYADDGFMLKAIATCKVVLEMDPGHKEVQQRLAELYSNRSSTPSPAVKVMADEQPSGQPTPAVGSMGLATDSIDLPTGEDDEQMPTSNVTPMEHLQADSFQGLPVIEMIEIEPLPLAPVETPPEPAEAVQTAEPKEPKPAVDAHASLELEPAGDLALELDTAPSATEAPTPSAEPHIPTAAELGIELEPIPRALPEAASQEPVAAIPTPDSQAQGDEAAGAAMPDPPGPGEAPPPAQEDQGEILPDIEITLDFEDEDAPPKREVSIDIPLFCDLEPEAFVAVLEQMSMIHMKPGQWVLKEGEPGSSMFTIASGKVRVLKRLEERKALQLAVLGEGAFFGEMSLLRGGVRGASIQALEAGDLFEISRELVDDLARQYPAITDVLGKFAQQRMLRNAMNTSPLFRPFNKEERVDIIERFVSRDVVVDEVLIEEGKESDGLYVVLRGQLDVYCAAATDEPIHVGELGEGDVFGEISCLRKEPAIATVRTRTPGTVLRLPRADFDLLVMSHPQILELVSSLGEQRIAITSNALAKKGILI